MSERCCATWIQPKSLGDILSRSLERMRAASVEIDSELQRIRACPEPCYDGTVRIMTSSGEIRRVTCPAVRGDCAYGSRLRAELDCYLEKTMSRLGIPRRHIENLAGMRESIAVREARKWPMRGFLVLCGKPGVGKSFGAACVVRGYLKSRVTNWIDRRTWEAVERAGDYATWCSAKGIVDDKRLASRVCAEFLLVMDDLGKEEDTQTGKAAICAVVSRRYDSMLATVITTELSMSDIRIRYGRYLTERLAEDAGRGGNIVDCGNVSMRLTSV